MFIHHLSQGSELDIYIELSSRMMMMMKPLVESEVMCVCPLKLDELAYVTLEVYIGNSTSILVKLEWISGWKVW